jgi:hypothetical protein
VITTRTPVADIADHEGSSALRRDLEQLSSDGGAKLLRALGVKGDEADLRTASDHCLALTLLGSYRRLPWRHSSPRRSISAPCSRPTTRNPCPKSHGIVPNLAGRGA